MWVDITRDHETTVRLQFNLFKIMNLISPKQIGIYTFNLIDSLINWSNKFDSFNDRFTVNTRLLYGSLHELSELVRDPSRANINPRVIRDVVVLAINAAKEIQRFIHGRVSRYFTVNNPLDLGTPWLWLAALGVALYNKNKKHEQIPLTGANEEEDFTAPINGSPTITSLFGETRVRKALKLNYQHKGIDLAAKIGTPVYVIYKGATALAHEVAGFGNCVVVKHTINGNQLRSVYGHLTDIKVRAGQSIATGQLIGTVGITGRILGKGGLSSAHLHFEMLPGWTSPLAPPSERIDPLAFFKEHDVTVGRVA